ncbi:hypothetical protein [Sulfitobacter profundi]|uniref:Uncharacterized protein n=1 Tax=Sulfitobacter profundi TaxID=2679961 RepID=A0ABW1Z299_9RHOB
MRSPQRGGDKFADHSCSSIFWSTGSAGIGHGIKRAIRLIVIAKVGLQTIGTGEHLLIIKEMAEAGHGSLTVNDDVGRVTGEFEVRVPAERRVFSGSDCA